MNRSLKFFMLYAALISVAIFSVTGIHHHHGTLAASIVTEMFGSNHDNDCDGEEPVCEHHKHGKISNCSFFQYFSAKDKITLKVKTVDLQQHFFVTTECDRMRPNAQVVATLQADYAFPQLITPEYQHFKRRGPPSVHFVS